MDNHPLFREVLKLRQSLFDEKFLDGHFVELEGLEELGNDNFVEHIMTIYSRDSTELIANVELELERTRIDFVTLDKALQNFKGSSSSIGANRVTIGIVHFRESLKQGDREAFKAAFQQLKSEHRTMMEKLKTYFRMRRQSMPVELAERPVYKDEDRN